TAGDEAIRFAAFGAVVGGRGFVPAMVAGETTAEAVLDQPGAAVRALEAEATMAAEGERGIAAAVEEQKRLRTAREALRHRGDQPRGKPAAPFGLLFGEVDRVDRR